MPNGVDRGALEAIGAADHQGVVAFVEPPSELSDRDVDDAEWEPDALVVILDGITDPQNLGACARAAEAAGGRSTLVARRREGRAADRGRHPSVGRSPAPTCRWPE